MEILANPQTSYLLQADLASLHAESKSWLEELDFWQDEFAFFFKLLHTKLASDAFPPAEISGFDKTLISLNADSTENLRAKVREHERTLAMALQSTSLTTEDQYRNTHRDLREKMIEVNMIIRNFKKEIYAFTRRYENQM